MNNVLHLKNGKKIELEWSFLVLEYLDEYPGGMQQLQKDIKLKQHQIRITNYFCYAVIRANFEEPITYTDAIKLVDLKGMKQITTFIEKNQNELEEFKKKDQPYFSPKKKKKKRK